MDTLETSLAIAIETDTVAHIPAISVNFCETLLVMNETVRSVWCHDNIDCRFVAETTPAEDREGDKHAWLELFVELVIGKCHDKGD